VEASLVVLDVGCYLFNEKQRIMDEAAFPVKPVRAAASLLTLSRGEIPKEIREVIHKAKNTGIDLILLEDESLANLITHEFGIKTKITHPLPAAQYVRSHYDGLAKRFTEISSIAMSKQHKVDIAILLMKEQLRRASEKKDLLVIQSVESLDEINKTLNLLVSRLREWNGLTFPELNRQISDHEQLARIIANLGSRDSMTAKSLTEVKIPESKAKRIAELAQQSIGAQLSSEDILPIQQLAQAILDMYQQRKNNEKYLEKTMKEIAPNMTNLIGAHISARLISLARGLDRLALMPSSTMQILGAEKALFRSKKSGSRPPKHGIIYQVSDIHEARRWQRGKISRLVAGKLSIAARVDAYLGKLMEGDLSADMRKRIEIIKKTSATPPPRKERAPANDRYRKRKPKQYKSRPQRRNRSRKR
jgi:nucleolar protein 56